MPTIQEVINDINQIDLSGRSGVDVNWPRVVKSMQALLALYQATERAGSIPTDHISSLMLGDGTTRKLRRVVYLPATTTVKIQKNTGSDATPVWSDLISIDASGNLTIAGAYTGTIPSHISTHLPGGSDPIPTATAVDVTTSSGAGSGTDLALANHTHKGIHSIDKDGSGSPLYGDVNFAGSTRIPLSVGSNTITVGFTSPNRVYVTTKSLGDQSIVSSTNKTVVTGCGNISITGSNGARTYAVYAQVNMSTTNVAFNNITFNVHLGPVGGSTDAVWWSTSSAYDISAGTKGISLCCNGIKITPGTTDKLTLSVELSASTATAHTIQHSDPKYCFLRIEEEL